MSKKFKKGDNVIIISGASKGKQGKIIVIADDEVVVEGVNIATIHKKPTQNSAGAIIKKEKPTHLFFGTIVSLEVPIYFFSLF